MVYGFLDHTVHTPFTANMMWVGHSSRIWERRSFQNVLCKT